MSIGIMSAFMLDNGECMKCSISEYVRSLGDIEIDYEWNTDDIAISAYSIGLQMGWNVDMDSDDEGLIVLIG